MNIRLLQTEPKWLAVDANLQAVEAMLEGIAPGTLAVLPELFATGFAMDDAERMAEASPEILAWMGQQAATREIYLLGGVARPNEKGQLCNQAILFNPDGEENSAYSKIHLFTPSDEDMVMAAGDQLVGWEVDEAILAPMVCYDLRFPLYFSLAAQEGVDLFCVIANWPAARADHFDVLLRARAIENQAYVVGVNRTGSDPNQDYIGGSVAYSPTGECLVRAGSEPAFVEATLDLDSLNEYRESFPVLDDGRPELEPLLP
jgi:omega-amidase